MSTGTAAGTAREVARRPLDRLSTALARRRRGGRRLRVVRRAAAVALFLLAGILALAPAPRPAGNDLVWAVARSLPIGSTLSTADLVAVTATGPPDGALSAATDIAGRVLAAPVRRGEILTDVRLVGSNGPDPGPGRVAVPIRPADAGTADLLSPGVHVAVIGVTTDSSISLLAEDAIVLSVRPPPAGGLTGSTSPGGPLVVLAVPAKEADAIIAMALTGSIGLRFR